RVTQKLFQSMGYRIGKTIGRGTYSKVCTAIDAEGHKLACKIINKRFAGHDFIERFLPRELRQVFFKILSLKKSRTNILCICPVDWTSGRTFVSTTVSMHSVTLAMEVYHPGSRGYGSQPALGYVVMIITAVKHPNIVTVYKILEANQIIYMFMDYCQNGDLLEYIRVHGPFSEDKAKFLFRQIVNAVNYLHKLDISHRDLKCENVLLMSNNQVKLADFGFARSCRNELGEYILSDTFCGSAAYAAPEILQFHYAYTTRLTTYIPTYYVHGVFYDPKMYDIWALGCILYVMMTASMPFDDSNITRMVKDQLSRSICGVTILWTDNSNDLKKLV
ncbi:hypothetical protein NQ318_007592, partial [Aromia moschata]